MCENIIVCVACVCVYVAAQAKVIIQAAYGSQRHLGVYTELGLQRDQIYILSRKTSKKVPTSYQVGLPLCPSRVMSTSSIDILALLDIHCSNIFCGVRFFYFSFR